MERLLIVEDELPMRTALQDVLQSEGYRVLTAQDGESGLRRAMEEKPDLILLDIMMPKLDGYAVCAELRRLSNPVPILMLTAKDLLEDKIQGLDSGADDYLVKPFHLAELKARIMAIYRRRNFQGQNLLDYEQITVDLDKKEVNIEGKPLVLTKKEFDMLLYFIANKDKVISHNALVDHLWRDEVIWGESFDFLYTHIKSMLS